MIGTLTCFCGCGKVANGWRGLNVACYMRFHTLIKAGKTTWEKLEKKGKVKSKDKETNRRWRRWWLAGRVYK